MMGKTGYILALLLLIAHVAEAKGGPRIGKASVRGVWLTTNYGLDWPSRRATTPAQAEAQKAELRRLLDMAEAMNLNTVFFQARVRSDVLYESEYEGYSSILTGVYGRKPQYDPLAFAVEEAGRTPFR